MLKMLNVEIQEPKEPFKFNENIWIKFDDQVKPSKTKCFKREIKSISFEEKVMIEFEKEQMLTFM